MAAAGIAATAAAAVLVSLNAMMTVTCPTGWKLVIVAVGSLLAGLVAGSYFGAPIGVEVTVCDTRWPVLGLTGLVMATCTGQRTPAAHLFTGSTPAVLAGVIQPAFALLSVALLGWALGSASNSSGPPSHPAPTGMPAVCALPASRSFPPNPARGAATGITDGCTPSPPIAASQCGQWPPAQNRPWEEAAPGPARPNAGCSRRQEPGCPGQVLH